MQQLPTSELAAPRTFLDLAYERVEPVHERHGAATRAGTPLSRSSRMLFDWNNDERGTSLPSRSIANNPTQRWTEVGSVCELAGDDVIARRY